MRKGKDILSVLLLGGMLLASCQKEQTSVPLPPSAEEEQEITLHFAIAQNAVTKANNSVDIAIEDQLQRLDLYFFYTNNYMDKDHMTIYPENGVIPSVTIKEKRDVRLGILAIGNLDEDTAAYLEGASIEDMYNASIPEGRIVLSAGNFAYDRIPMIGTCLADFNSSNTLFRTVELRRIMARIDIRNIVIDFTNPELLGKDVKLKNIALINATNFFSVLHSSSLGYFYSTYATFGNEYTNMQGGFGGVKEGFDYYVPNYSYYTAYNNPLTYNGPGKLNNVSYPDFFNVNFKLPAGTLNIDAEGIMLESTYQHYEDGEGQIVTAGDMAQRHVFPVGKCFYSLLSQVCNHNYASSCDYKDQNFQLKLVCELEIDGTSYFYPIPLYLLQPNTVYQIENITIRDLGSMYSNFYEKKYELETTVSIVPWESVDVNNLNVGVDPITGRPVEN